MKNLKAVLKLAKACGGLTEAFLIIYIYQSPKTVHDNKSYSVISLSKFQETFPFESKLKLKTKLQKLVDKGFLIKGS